MSEAPAATTPEKPTSEAPTTESTEPTTTAPKAQSRQASGVNPDIKVEITSLEVAPNGGQGQQITVDDNVKVSGTWDAKTANPQPGQEFTINFPEELKLGGDVDFDLMGEDDQGVEHNWGTCKATTSNVLTCVFSADVADRSDVHGTFFLFAKAEKRTTAKDVEFNLNGVVENVKLPGTDGGITDGKVIDPANKIGKLQNDKRRVEWTINVPGADLAALPGGATGSVELTDTLSDNMRLCSAALPGNLLNAQLWSGRPGDLKKIEGVTITQGPDGGPVSIVINEEDGVFDSDHVYQIKYTSCATNSEIDDKGIAYTNSVDIGGNKVSAGKNGEGIKQDFEPKTTPSKSGSWADEPKYSKLNWEITIPGAFAFNADGTAKVLTIKEELIANHSVCEGGVAPKVYREKRAPDLGSNDKGYDVTDQFVATASDVTAKSFTVTLTPKDPAKVELDFEKYYYYVKYETCRDGDVVPDHKTEFTNVADVNGTEVKATVPGHEFKGDKSGRINNDRENLKAVAGEKQPAGTTIDWFVEVDGRNLEGLESAVITDKFSGTMAVCEVTGDLKKDLNLTVMKAGRLDTSGAGGENITAGTTVSKLIPNGIEITVPKPEAGFDREARYFIEYTLCTSSGGLDEYGTKYKNEIEYKGQELGKAYEQTWGGGGTGTGASRGSFSLLKQIDSSSEKFPEGTEFTVKVEEFAPNVDPAIGPVTSSYDITVKADGTPVNGLNARGTGWTIRLSEVNLPQVDGVYFEQGKFSPADNVTLTKDDTVAMVKITPKSNVEVKLVNKAVLGSAKITKTVLNEEGAQLTGNESFVFTATIEGNPRPFEFTLTDNSSIDLPDLPIGAKVTFAEVKPMDTDFVTWSEPVFDKNPLVIGTDATANMVNVTNTAKVTQGTFELSKKLTGPEAFNKDVPKTFDVVATWEGGGPKRLTLPSDGTPVQFGEYLPGGTKVTLTETLPANGNGLAWGLPAFSGNVTIDDDGNAVVTIGKDPGTVTVTNFVDKNDGTLRILKQVEGEAAGETAGEDVVFTVEASWKDGVNYAKETLTVKKGVATPLKAKLPVGTEVTFKEVGRPDLPKVEWGTITWGTDPNGESWLKDNGDGSVTGIVSDDPTEGRLITLMNEAKWKFGSVEFTKHILGEDGKTTPATEAELPAGAEFEVKIDGIDPPLPEGTDFPAVNETITLNAGNGFTWTSGDVLPRDTVVTFSEVDPKPLAGIDWARPYYWVAEDAGEAEYRNTVGIVPGEEAVVEIRNRIIPTTDVDIDKIVTGPKGDKVMKDPSSTFQITATWTDVDDEARSCVLDVKPGGSVTPTAACDASVIDGKVQFPLNTAINFVETGAHTDVTNVEWGEVKWGVKDGEADIATIDGVPTGTTVTFTGDANESVVLGLENKTSSKGLIIIPLPIPLPPWGGGSWNPQFPGPGPGPGPDGPVVNPGPNEPGGSGHNGAPGKPAPTKPDQSSSLPVTGANVIWLVGAAIALIAGGTLLTLRNRRKSAGQE